MKSHISVVMVACVDSLPNKSLDWNDVVPGVSRQAMSSRSLQLYIIHKHWDLNKLGCENTSPGVLKLNFNSVLKNSVKTF